MIPPSDAARIHSNTDGDDAMYTPEAQAELSRRLDRFTRTQDPSALWPGLTEHARVAAAGEIERVTRAVLSGQRDVQMNSDDAHDVQALSVAAHTTGMGPLLGRWVEDAHISAPPAHRERLAWQLRHARRRAARMECDVLPALDAMLAHHVVPVVLKGFHTARAYFEEPGVRRMSDVDLLVAPDQVHRAESALRASGSHATGPRMTPYKQDWIGAGTEDRVYSVEASDERTKWVIELHASLQSHLSSRCRRSAR